MKAFPPALWLVMAVALGAHGVARAEPGRSVDARKPAKELFGRMVSPATMKAAAIGFYTHGCLAGGIALPITGNAWQVMRPSRNRNWGHPSLVQFIQRLAEKVPVVGWRGLLVGDMAQARGGPMLTGHASHQVGLDADIWLMQMPNRELTREEREEISAINVVARNRLDVDPKIWTPQHGAVIRIAAEDAATERIFVNPAIKKALCREAGEHCAWLRKVRPWHGHDYHFHVRMSCPIGSPDCKPQDVPPDDDGCGKELEYWFSDEVLHPKPTKKPVKPPLTLADLPAACRDVLLAP